MSKASKFSTVTYHDQLKNFRGQPRFPPKVHGTPRVPEPKLLEHILLPRKNCWTYSDVVWHYSSGPAMKRRDTPSQRVECLRPNFLDAPYLSSNCWPNSAVGAFVGDMPSIESLSSLFFCNYKCTGEGHMSPVHLEYTTVCCNQLGSCCSVAAVQVTLICL